MDWHEKTKALSTERLHKLDLYWRDNFENPVHQQRHSMVQMILQEQGEQTLKLKKQEQSKELNRSLRISNPLSRILSEINGLLKRSIPP